jgi:tripartite-type tricarboxylate transporter receptor subunit TctC
MKRLMAVIAATGLAIISYTVAADPVADFYKGKQVKIIIGGGMSGSYALYGQFLARHFSRHLPGAPTVVVQSMTGGGNKAMNYTYNAGPQDGSVVSLPQISLVQESLFNPKARFDAKGYQYIGRFTNSNIVSVAHKRTGVQKIADAAKKS